MAVSDILSQVKIMYSVYNNLHK